MKTTNFTLGMLIVFLSVACGNKTSGPTNSGGPAPKLTVHLQGDIPGSGMQPIPDGPNQLVGTVKINSQQQTTVGGVATFVGMAAGTYQIAGSTDLCYDDKMVSAVVSGTQNTDVTITLDTTYCIRLIEVSADDRVLSTGDAIATPVKLSFKALVMNLGQHGRIGFYGTILATSAPAVFLSAPDRSLNDIPVGLSMQQATITNFRPCTVEEPGFPLRYTNTCYPKSDFVLLLLSSLTQGLSPPASGGSPRKPQGQALIPFVLNYK